MTTTRRKTTRKRATVDRIESDPKDPRLARIMLEGTTRSVATVGRELLSTLGIREGTVWTAQLEKRVRAVQAERDARSHALSMLARSSQSAESIRRALLRRGVLAEIVESTVKSLVADRWIDEESHAALRADRLSAARPGASEAHLSEALEHEGIIEPLAVREARRVAGGADSAARALSLARVAIKRRGRRTVVAVAQSLIRKGFDASIIKDAMRREGFDCDEE